MSLCASPPFLLHLHPTRVHLINESRCSRQNGLLHWGVWAWVHQYGTVELWGEGSLWATAQDSIAWLTDTNILDVCMCLTWETCSAQTSQLPNIPCLHINRHIKQQNIEWDFMLTERGDNRSPSSECSVSFITVPCFSAVLWDNTAYG